MAGIVGFTAMDFEISERGKAFAHEYGLTIVDRLGFGVQGAVYQTSARTAMKVFNREDHYLRERDVYRRLFDLQVTKIRGCDVPELLNYNNRFLVIEMTIVEPPFALDFASTYLNRKPDFSEEVLADKMADCAERFGDDWPEVELIIAAFERYGIYLVDVHPGNIRLES